MSEDDKPAEANPADAKDKPKNRNFKAGMGVGIGSAAIVAALLYARSGKPRNK
uniref:hypothetical protein n=1 Tax=uncultured Sphingomonas sp. TaxID=158754 RepID=UPI0025F38D69|nr:hypothetical protein [uncultured Sphingomonas sp.]